MPAKNKSNELKLTRFYDAPVELVWEAWTDPKQVAQWWGPRGFTLTTHSKDLRPGGHWAYTMHGPDGKDYPNKTIYHEVEKHSKLVYDHGGNDDQPPLFRVCVLFSQLNGKTKMEMTMTLPTPEAAEETRKFIKKARGDSTWDRLGEYLEKLKNDKEKFIIHRSFPVSIEAMYELWTKPEHLARWVPPGGFTLEYLQSDIRPGGRAFYKMGNSQFTMYGRAEYLEFSKPNRIAYTQQFADEKGNPARHPLAPEWPKTLFTLVELSEEAPRQTRVKLSWEPHGAVTFEELQAFIQGRTQTAEGWNGSFDQLEQYLEGLNK